MLFHHVDRCSCNVNYITAVRIHDTLCYCDSTFCLKSHESKYVGGGGEVWMWTVCEH